MGRTSNTNWEEENSYVILVRKPEGKRPQGRPSRRCVDNTDIYRTGRLITFRNRPPLDHILSQLNPLNPFHLISFAAKSLVAFQAV
jgi:hypothetical protein